MLNIIKDKIIIDNFEANVFLDKDNQYLAYFDKLPNISAFADTKEKAIEELKIAWDVAKETYQMFDIEIPSQHY